MLTIDIVSDIVCPWCFIGKRRLEAAIATVRHRHPDFACQTRWLPFFLNRDTPAEGDLYLPFLERKFGSRDAVEALFENVREAGLACGIDFAFDKVQLRANTLKAHRLIHWAQLQGAADALVERLFVAQFQRGEAVGDVATLIRIAAECGYDECSAGAYLDSSADGELVCDLEHRIRAFGISMVPTFIVAQARIIVGAEDPAILATAIMELIGRSQGAAAL